MPLIKNSFIYLLTALVFAGATFSLSAADEYPEQTVKILAKYKIKMKKVVQAKDKLAKMAKQTALVNLSKEMTQLTQAADLDRAIAARDLLRTLKKDGVLPEISVDDKKYRQNSVNIVKIYKKRKKQVDDYYEKNKTKIMTDLNTELDEEMVKMDKEGFIADSLTIKQLIAKTKEPGFNLATFKFAIQKAPSKKEVPKEEKKVAKKPEVNYDELIQKTALAMGNNILSDDITSEKGMIYVCFAENLNPSDKVPLVREKIEKGLFLPILPCSMSEEDFLGLIEKYIRKLLVDRPHHQDLLKYSVLVCHFKTDLKKDKDIGGFVTKSGQPNDIAVVLKYSKDMFGGSNEAEDIRMQIDNNDGDLIIKLRNQAQELAKKYPKNKDVKKLVTDLAAIKLPEKPQPKPVAKPAAPEEPKKDLVDCRLCVGTGQAEVDCTKCKEKDKQMCDRCIGSGVVYAQGECADCKGSGKTWLGMACKKCNGKGKVRQKKDCPECEGKGTKKCPDCGNKGFVKKECPDCQGKGKVEK